MLRLVKEVVYSHSQDKFDRNLLKLVEGVPPSFTEYFQKNWLASAAYWAAHLTNSFVNLGNTMNRIESHNQKLKTGLNTNRDLSLASAVHKVLLLTNCKGRQSTHKTFEQEMKVPYRLGDHDAVVDTMVKSLTL